MKSSASPARRSRPSRPPLRLVPETHPEDDDPEIATEDWPRSIPVRPLESTRALSREEINRLFVRTRRGDVAARNAIVAANMGFVYKTAVPYARQALVEYEELVTLGAQGLMRAIEGYEPERGLQFLTYAANWVRQFMSRGIDRERARLAGQLHLVGERHWFNRYEDLVFHGADPDAAVDAIAARAKMLPRRVREIVRTHQTLGTLSLDAPIVRGGVEVLSDAIESPSNEDPCERIDRDRLRERVRRAVRCVGMSDRERAIVKMRLLADEPATLEVIAAEFGGLSCERVRQIEAKLLAKIAASMRRMGLGEMREGGIE